METGGVHGGHGQVEAINTIPVLEVGHGGLGAAARGEGREGQLAVRGQPDYNTQYYGHMVQRTGTMGTIEKLWLNTWADSNFYSNLVPDLNSKWLMCPLDAGCGHLTWLSVTMGP